MTAAAVLTAIVAFLDLARMEFAAASPEDQKKLATIHAHVLERLSDLLNHVEDGVDKLKAIINPVKTP